MAPSLCACTAFKQPSLIETPGAFLLRRLPRSPAAARVVLAGRAVRRFSVVTAFPPNRARTPFGDFQLIELAAQFFPFGIKLYIGDIIELTDE